MFVTPDPPEHNDDDDDDDGDDDDERLAATDLKNQARSQILRRGGSP